MGLRVRGGPEHRRGVRERSAAQARRLPHPHGARRRVPARGAPMSRLRRPFSSVRARAALAATLVVAVALVAAGATVLLSLRGNLTEQAGRDADSTARRVATSLATGTAPDALDLDDEDPIQVVDDDGRVLGTSEDLEK